jgi:hypothetical protein
MKYPEVVIFEEGGSDDRLVRISLELLEQSLIGPHLAKVIEGLGIHVLTLSLKDNCWHMRIRIIYLQLVVILN